MDDERKVCEKDKKHIILDSAIRRMDNVIGRSRDVLNKIKGDSRDIAGDEEKCEEPTLQEVLENGSSRIINSCEEIHKILNEIEDTLF